MSIPVWQRPYAIGPAETTGTMGKTRARVVITLLRYIV